MKTALQQLEALDALQEKTRGQSHPDDSDADYLYLARSIDAAAIAQRVRMMEAVVEAAKHCVSRMRGHPMWDSDDAGPCSTLRIVEAALAALEGDSHEQ